MNQQQMQQCRMVSQEELAKTQVLNLTDVQEIAKYERKVSKRPAFLFAFAGVLAISLGFAYPNIMTAIDSMPSTVSSSFVDNIEDPVLNNEVVNANPNVGSCVYTSSLNADGTQGTTTYNFNFQDGLLQSYTKVLLLNQIQEAGLVSINNIYNTYKPLDTLQINGYQVSTTYTQTGVSVTTTIDLTQLDKTLLPVETGQVYSSVEYNLGDAKDVIYANLSQNGYVCE